MRLILALASLLAAPTWASQDPATPAHEGHGAAAKEPGAKATEAKTPVSPAQRDGVAMTIVAEVMDPACFLEAGPKSIGPGHYQCALDCVRSGQTLALYDREADRIYFIAGELPGKNPNTPLLPYVHKKVDVTGVVFHRADAYGIVINKVVPHVETPGEKAPTAKKGSTSDAAPGSGATKAASESGPEAKGAGK